MAKKVIMAIKKIWAFIKKAWKWLLPILTAISGAVFVLFFKTNKKNNKNYINNNDGTITVVDKENDSVTTIETSVNNPDSASFPTKIKNNNGEVTINHETTNRKDPDNKSIADSAYNRIRGK